MVLSGNLSFGGTERIEPSGKDDHIFNGGAHGADFEDEFDADEFVLYENPQTGETFGKRAASPNATDDKAVKKHRVPGGKAAVPKRIVADYDSDDGRIISLKQQGYGDEYVSSKLIQEGRIRYVPKTVGSRWIRLRKALEQAENEKLDDELSDWHVGEDDELHVSYAAITKKYEKEMEKVLERKWKEISANLAARLRRKKYTANACKERHEGIQSGTALLPIEIDNDKAGRTILRETRIREAKRRRAAQAAESQRDEDEKKRRIEEKKAADAEKERQRILKVHERQRIVAEEARIKQERITAREEKRIAKKAALARIRAEEDWAFTRRETAAEMYEKMTGKTLPGAPGLRPVGRRGSRCSGEDFVDDDGEDAMSLDDDGEDEMTDYETEQSDIDSAGHLDGSSSNLGNGSSSVNASTAPTPVRARKVPTVSMKPKVTKETLLNPRSIMTDAELDVLLFHRELPRRTMRETHPQVVARLHAADCTLTTIELSDLLRPYFDKGKGSKESKVKRLQVQDAAKSAAGEEGITSADLEFKKGYEGYKGEYRSLIGDDGSE